MIIRTAAALLLAAGALAFVAPAPTMAAPVDTPIVYQGRLEENGQPANGTFEMVFLLYENPGDIWPLNLGAPPVVVQVEDGLFTAEVDLDPADAYTGAERWLEIQVRRPGEPQFTPLSPRRRMAPAPFANLALDIPQQWKSFRWISGVGPVYNGSGNVGIGTDAPAQRLHLVGQGGTNVNGLRLTHPGTGADWDLLVGGSSNTYPGGFAIAYQGTAFAVVDRTGNVGIGTTTPQRQLDVNGWARLWGFEVTGGADIAEPFEVNAVGAVEPGMVVCIDPERPGELRVADDPYDRTDAGVISGAGGVNTGVMLRHEGTAADGTHPVALTGRVYCYVDADAGGPVRPGDLLTTSDTPGHAMRVADPDRAQGAIIGKAMTGLESGRGLVLVLISLQ